jgi:hypothetical protein
MDPTTADRMEATYKEKGWKPEEVTGHKVWIEKKTEFDGECHRASHAVQGKVMEGEETLRQALPEKPIRNNRSREGYHGRDALYHLLNWKQKFWLFLGRREWTNWIRNKLFKQAP